jgi:superfamily II DNA or RNA helicase
MRQLRPHQIEAINMIRRSFASGNKRVILQGSVGFGKTFVSSTIVKSALGKGNSVIFTVPIIALVDQAIVDMEKEGITDIGVMQANHPRTNASAKVQVCSVQTLAKRGVPKASLVIQDEAHIRDKTIFALMEERPDLHFIGLTATPWSQGLGLYWQDLLIPATLPYLVKEGFLSESTVYAPDVPDMSKVKTVAGDYQENDAIRVMEEGGIVANAVQTWLQKGEGRPTLCFGVNRAHAKSINAMFEAAGIASRYVDGTVDSIMRQKYFDEFRRGEIKVICSVRTMTTGIDLPVSCIVDCAPTKSEILHMQKIGRGLRVNPGTEKLTVLDHAGNSLRLGLVEDIHHETLNRDKPGSKEKQEEKKKEKLPHECKKCGVLHTGMLCYNCGNEIKISPNIEVAEGELVQISGKQKKYSMEEKQLWWSAIKTIQRERGLKEGWASHTYKKKFGVWPKGLRDYSGPVPEEVRNYVKSLSIAFAKRKAA